MFMNNSIKSIKKFIMNLIYHDVFTRSAALAYYLVFSIFPSILFLYSVIGFLDIDWIVFLESIKGFLPNDVFEVLSESILYVAPKNDIMFLFTGLFTSLYSSYKAVKCIRRGLNLAYGTSKHRSGLQEFMRSMLFTVLVYVSILIDLIIVPMLSGVIELFSSNFSSSKFSIVFWNVTKNILSIVPVLLCLLFLYYLSPKKKIPFIIVLPGALFATVGISVLSSVLGFFTINAVKYSSTYGSLATVIVFILWLYFVSLIILIGGEISAEILYNSKYESNEV